MPSKTSLFNKEIFLQINRSIGWISIVFFLGLLFVLPIKIVMMYFEYNESVVNKGNMEYYSVDSLYHYDTEIQLALLMIIPVLTAVFLFRYLHVKQSADLMHCIPIRREKIFHHYAITGVTLLVVPIVINSLIVFILYSVLDIKDFFNVEDIFYWTGTTIVISLLLFTAGVLVAMMTGISAVQAVLTYIFLFFPFGFTMLLEYNLRNFLFGFAGDYYLNKEFERISPLLVTAGLWENPIDWKDAIIYLFSTIVFYGLALFFYKKRNLETASEAISFTKLRAVFKYGVTFCTMLLMGMYFSGTQNNKFTWLIAGYVIGAIVGYYIAEMVLQKTWRVFSRIKGLVIYGITVGLCLTAIQVFGAKVNQVPNHKDVASVTLADDIHLITEENPYEYYYRPKPMKNPKSIEAVRKLHKQIVADKKINQGKGYYYTAYFKYELKNGHIIVRQYKINQAIYEEYFQDVFELKEYKTSTNEIFRMNVKEIDHITISPSEPADGKVFISEKQDIQEALAALKEDIIQEAYLDKMYYQSRGSNIEIKMNDEYSAFLNFKPSYQQFTKWLKDHQLLERAKITSADISYLLVAKMKESEREYVSPEQIAEIIKKKSDHLKITDKELIELSLDRLGSSENHKYLVVMYFYEGAFPEVFYFDEKHVPDFIKEHFK